MLSNTGHIIILILLHWEMSFIMGLNIQELKAAKRLDDFKKDGLRVLGITNADKTTVNELEVIAKPVDIHSKSEIKARKDIIELLTKRLDELNVTNKQRAELQVRRQYCIPVNRQIVRQSAYGYYSQNSKYEYFGVPIIVGYELYNNSKYPCNYLKAHYNKGNITLSKDYIPAGESRIVTRHELAYLAILNGSDLVNGKIMCKRSGGIPYIRMKSAKTDSDFRQSIRDDNTMISVAYITGYKQFSLLPEFENDFNWVKDYKKYKCSKLNLSFETYDYD